MIGNLLVLIHVPSSKVREPLSTSERSEIEHGTLNELGESLPSTRFQTAKCKSYLESALQRSKVTSRMYY